MNGLVILLVKPFMHLLENLDEQQHEPILLLTSAATLHFSWLHMPIPPISCRALRHYRPTQAGLEAATSRFAFVVTVALAFVLQPSHLALAAVWPMCRHPLYPILIPQTS